MTKEETKTTDALAADGGSLPPDVPSEKDSASDNKKKLFRKGSPLLYILRVIQGIIIGGGAILPGVSGGVLAASFGVYRPMMEVLSHPKTGLKKHFGLMLSIGIGWVAGFFLGTKLILMLFGVSANLAICLFIGLIAGELPSLFHEAGTRGRTEKTWIIFVISLFMMIALFRFTEGLEGSVAIKASFPIYIACGATWGFSMIVPGFTTSSMLIYLGLYEDLMASFVGFDLMAILGFAIGFVSVLLLLARAVNKLYQKSFSAMSHIVIGFVIASTVSIVPSSYISVWNALCSLGLFFGGFALAILMEKFIPKEE